MAECKLNLCLEEISRGQSRIKVALIDAFGKIHFNSKVSDDLDTINGIIDDLDQTIHSSKEESKKLLKQKKELKLKLKQETDPDKKEDIKLDIDRSIQRRARQQDIEVASRKEKKAKKKDKIEAEVSLRQGRNKSELIQNINRKLYDRIDKLFITKGYNGDPHIYVNALKGFFLENKFVFNELQDLDVDSLRSLNNYIDSVFKKQDKGVKIGTGIEGTLVDEFYDPVFAAILHDKSLNSLDIIQRSKKFSDDREKDIRLALEPVKQMQEFLNRTIKDLLINNNLFWGLTKEQLKLFPKNKKTWTAKQKLDASEMVSKKVNEFFNDLADGQVRQLKAGKRHQVEDLLKKGTFKTKFGALSGASDMLYDSQKQLDNIVNEAIKHQFDEFGQDSIGPNLDYIEKDGKRYYFAMIKEKERGQEVYRAYYVPTNFNKKSQTHSLKYKYINRKVEGRKLSFVDPKYTENIDKNEALFIKFWKEQGGNGFYKSDKDVVHRGLKERTMYDPDKVNEEMVVSAWSRFTEGGKMKNEDVPHTLLKPPSNSKFDSEKHDTLWESLSQIRIITNDLYLKMRDKSLINNKKLTAGLKLLKQSLTVEDYNDLRAEISNIMGIDVKIEVFEGKIYSQNNSIGEIKENYFPRKYADGERAAQIVRVITALKASMTNMESSITSTELQQDAHKNTTKTLDNNLINKLSYQKESLKGLDEMLKVFEAKQDMIINKTTQREYNQLKGSVSLRSGRQRTIHTNAKNRRKDENVIVDHIQDMYADLHYNSLISDILPSLAGLSDRRDLIEYSVDHIRATVGMDDTRASLFGFDMSFPGWAERLKKIPLIRDKYNEKDISKMLRTWSQVNSGNLLRTMSSLANNTQRLNFGIDHGVDLTKRMYDFISENEEVAEQLAAESGVLDLVNSLADMLVGGFNQRAELKDGFAPLRDIALLKASKSEFLSSTGWFRDLFATVVTNKDGNIKEQDLKKEIKLLMDNTWEITHGITEGTLSRKELKSLMKSFKDYGLQQHYINRYVSYGLSYLPKFFEKGKWFFTFTGAEKQMRMEAAVINYLSAKDAGLVREFSEDEDSSAWKLKYSNEWLEPKVLEVIRTGVYGSMFGMSTNFHPKIFRGANKLMFQFKQFPYFQLKNDWMLFRNWRNSIKGLPAAQQAKEWSKMLIPSGEYGKFSVDKSDTRSKLRRFLLTRGLISFSSTLFFYIPGLNAVTNFSKRFIGKRLSRVGLGYGFGNAMGRGMTSPLVNLPTQMLILLLNSFFAIRGDEDEDLEEDASIDVYRFFLPFFINIGLELFKSDSKAEHVMHFVPGVSDASDAILPVIDYMSD